MKLDDLASKSAGQTAADSHRNTSKMTGNENSAESKSVLMRLTALFELGRYFLLSFVALGTDLGLFFVLENYLGVNYLLANPISFLAGLTVIYLGSIFWVFRHRAVENRLLEFVGFCAIGVGGFFVNELALWLFVDWFSAIPIVAKGIAAVCSFIFNFVMRKLILFS